MRAHLLRVLVVAVALTAGFARADEVPVNLQIQLLSKMTTAIPAMQPAEGSKIKVLVITPGSVSSPSRGAQALITAIKQVAKFGAFDADAQLVSVGDVKSALAVEKARVVYLAPELDEKSVSSVLDATSGSSVLTVCGTREQVKLGIILGFELAEARPVVLVNLKQARKENLDFKNQFLTHTTIVEK
ncbi:MAG: YfiR/HmsC family protein [Myxococcaceae bacterium]